MITVESVNTKSFEISREEKGWKASHLILGLQCTGTTPQEASKNLQEAIFNKVRSAMEEDHWDMFIRYLPPKTSSFITSHQRG